PRDVHSLTQATARFYAEAKGQRAEMLDIDSSVAALAAARAPAPAANQSVLSLVNERFEAATIRTWCRLGAIGLGFQSPDAVIAWWYTPMAAFLIVAPVAAPPSFPGAPITGPAVQPLRRNWTRFSMQSRRCCRVVPRWRLSPSSPPSLPLRRTRVPRLQAPLSSRLLRSLVAPSATSMDDRMDRLESPLRDLTSKRSRSPNDDDHARVVRPRLEPLATAQAPPTAAVAPPVHRAFIHSIHQLTPHRLPI
ncbi:hypothetical protein B0H17DRAFT_1095356, partial [Mycena rosella]